MHSRHSKNKIINSSQDIVPALMPYARRLVFTLALVWAGFLYLTAANSYPTTTAALIILQRWFGFTALGLVYVVLLPGLLRVYFPRFFLNPLLIKARRAIGLSLFSFATIHMLLGFFVNLSGSFQSIFLLPLNNQWAVVFAVIAFCIFLSMAATSFDSMVRRLGAKRWKMLHRLVYVAGILVIFHAFLIGSHFTNTKNIIPLLVNFASLAIILLEIGATLRKLSEHKDRISESRYAFSYLALGILALGALYFSFTGVTSPSYDPHAEHRIVTSGEPKFVMNVVGRPQYIEPKKPFSLHLQIIDTQKEAPVSQFQLVHEKLLHLIVLRSDLTDYQHLHPILRGDQFIKTLTLPEEGEYMLFAEYQPKGQLAQESEVKLTTKNGKFIPAKLTVSPLSQQFGQYRVDMRPEGIAAGRDANITFVISDARTRQQITDLEPYLGAFGHLVVVSEDGKTYLHVHPSLNVFDSRQRGGPEIVFQTQFAKAGKYKIFLQFQHRGKVQLAEFVIDVPK